MHRRIVLLGILVLFFVAASADQGPLLIFHAGSLAAPLRALADGFRALYPNVRFAPEASGSLVAARKVRELRRPADLVLVADSWIIDRLLIPEYAAFNIQFAGDEMVIAYTPRSRYADEITPNNWFEILLREGVRYGHSDPDLDPAGYRTLLLWQLSELYYGLSGLYEELRRGCPPGNVRPMSVALIALLEAGELDYVFLYRAVAMQQGFKFLELPSEINLGQLEYADFYAQAAVEVAGATPKETLKIRGAPITYGLTIPFSAPHFELALEFVRFVLGPEGQRILKTFGLSPIVPAVASMGQERIPSKLRDLVVRGD